MLVTGVVSAATYLFLIVNTKVCLLLSITVRKIFDFLSSNCQDKLNVQVYFEIVRKIFLVSSTLISPSMINDHVCNELQR